MGKIIARRNPSGKVVYGIRWQDEAGNDCKRSSRSWTKEQAKAELSKIEQRLREGVATNSKMTVADLFQEWHEHHVLVSCSPVYALDSERQFRLRIEPTIGHRKIDTVNKRLAKQMIAQMQGVMRAKEPGNEYAGHATINKTMTVLKGMFSYAVEIEQLAANPIHGVGELEVKPTRQVTAWPLEVVREIALAAKALPDRLPAFQRSQQAEWAGEIGYAIIMLAALSGLRQSELLGLSCESIDGDWIHVTHKLCRVSFTQREPKSKRGRRRVPILGMAREVLNDWHAIRAHDEILFPNHGGLDYLRASHFDKKVWDKARDAVGIVEYEGVQYDCRELTFHELRHTFVSLCLSAGRSVWEVANWIGDDPDLVKDVYGHYLPDSLGDTTQIDKVLNVDAGASRKRPRKVAS